MSRKIEPPEDLPNLIQEYLAAGESLLSLEKKYGHKRYLLKRWFRESGIQLKTHVEAMTDTGVRLRSNRPSDETLRRLYVDRTPLEIGRIYDVGVLTAISWLREAGVEKRSHGAEISFARQKGFESRLPSIPDLAKRYKDSGYNKTKLIKDLGVTRNQLDRLFEVHELETVAPQRSVSEADLFQFLNEADPKGGWFPNRKDVIPSGLELDIYSEERNFAVEYCGLYWHSEKSSGRDRSFHRRKLEECRELGIRLVTVFDTDPMLKVKMTLLAKLGRNNVVGARKCRVEEVSGKEVKEFETTHHLSGHHPGSIKLGLRENGELVSTMTFGRSRFNKGYEYEVIRYTVAGMVTVVGGAEKLFAEFVRRYNPSSVISYADLRFGTGEYCRRLGFKKLRDSPPGYWYHRRYVAPLYSRVKFQKAKLKDLLEFFDPSMTEWENMKANGYDRIWDCGNAVWVWTK